MKVSLKYAVASVIAAVAAAGATTASADVVAPTTGNAGNAELVLFVRNLDSATNVYARGLGITINDILTTPAIQSGPYTGPVQDFSYVLPTIAADSTLSTFLGQSSTSGFVWTIMAADTVATTSTTNATNLGARRAIATIQTNYPEDASSSITNNNLAQNMATNAYNSMITELNSNLPDPSGSSTGTGGLWGQPSTSGTQATDYFGVLPNENFVSDTGSAFFYLFANDAGAGLTGTTFARVYQFANVRLTTAGLLAGIAPVSEVPLPAAAWLFGSGLLGLMGIGRRRQAAAVAA